MGAAFLDRVGSLVGGFFRLLFLSPANNNDLGSNLQ